MLVYFYGNKPIDQYNFKCKCGKIRRKDINKGYQNVITHNRTSHPDHVQVFNEAQEASVEGFCLMN